MVSTRDKLKMECRMPSGMTIETTTTTSTSLKNARKTYCVMWFWIFSTSNCTCSFHLCRWNQKCKCNKNVLLHDKWQTIFYQMNNNRSFFLRKNLHLHMDFSTNHPKASKLRYWTVETACLESLKPLQLVISSFDFPLLLCISVHEFPRVTVWVSLVGCWCISASPLMVQRLPNSDLHHVCRVQLCK